MQKNSHSAAKQLTHYIIIYILIIIFLGLSITFIVLYIKTQKTCNAKGSCDAIIQKLLIYNANSTPTLSVNLLFSLSFVLTNLSTNSITMLSADYPTIVITGSLYNNDTNKFSIVNTNNFNITDNMLIFPPQHAFDSANILNKWFSGGSSKFNISVSAKSATGAKSVIIPCSMLVTYVITPSLT